VYIADGKSQNQHSLCDESEFAFIADVLLNPRARIIKDKVMEGCSSEFIVVVVPTISL
jgi:hypothetical protein